MFEELQSKIKIESKKINLIVFLLILLLSLWLFYDFHSKQAMKEGKMVGRVVYKVNEVNRKLGSQVLWEDVEINSAVYNYDTIRTDQFSKITVLLNDKTEIQLESNSMVVFDMEKDNLNVNFLEGKMQLNSLNVGEDAKNLKIKSGDSEIKLDKGDIKLTKASDSILDIDVRDGKAEVKKGENVREIKKDEELKIRGEKFKQTKRKIRLLSPINSKYFLTQASFQEVRFEWEGDDSEEEGYFVEIYNISGRPKRIRYKSIKEKTYLDKFEPGKYKWQVTNSKKEDIQSDNFYIVDDNPVAPFTPENGASFFYLTEPPRILLSWSRNEFIPYYKLEVSTTPDFSKLVTDRLTENESTVVDDLKKGTYYYRILTKTGFPDSAWRISKTKTFIINERSAPSPPELLSPPKDHNFSEEEPLNFAWKSSESYVTYRLQIAKDKEFQSIVEDQKTELRSIRLKKSLEEGRYFWRVQGFLKDGKSKIDSEILSFGFSQYSETQITLIEPKNHFETKETKVQFAWESSPKKDRYTLELSGDPEFKELIKSAASQTNSLVLTPLEPGHYYWRVKVQGNKNRSTTSSAGVFSILYDPTPTILFPKDKSKIDLADKEQLYFKWDNVSGAISYELELTELAGNKRILKKSGIKTNEFTLDDISLLKTGDYLLKVRANIAKSNLEETISKPGISKFGIFLSKTIKQEDIKFITPENVYIE
ncbi:MAG: FecR domain-containing protein [Leptospiraceae bacterium]|nr:FecR domain-containing protein [Leptospiraceae bacterium]